MVSSFEFEDGVLYQALEALLVQFSCVWKKIGLLLVLLRESLYQIRLGALP